MLEAEGYLVREDKVVIEIEGPEALRWLHSLTSQNLANLKPGESAETLLLNPQGHIEHQIGVVATERGCYLIVNAERADALTAWLNKMVFRTKVSIRNTELVVVGAFADLGIDAPCWIDPFSKPGSVRYASERADFPYREYLVSEAAEPVAGFLAYQALRIAAGRPEISDVDDRTLPHELDWLSSAVHMSKGCYRGQESVAKVHNLGHPPRRLCILHFQQGDVLPAPGAEVSYSDKSVGKVLASALHFELGAIALALVARNTPYLDLSVEGNLAQQQVLVPHDAGKAANLPRPSAFKLSGKK